MPIYEFKCEKCNLKFEKIFSKITVKQQEDCPCCGEKSDKIMSASNFKINESTNIPKEIDLKVGADSEKKWIEYEDRKSIKNKVREENETKRLSRDLEGNYSPLAVTKEGQLVSEEEGVKIRKEMYNDYKTIRNDPNSEKVTPEE